MKDTYRKYNTRVKGPGNPPPHGLSLTKLCCLVIWNLQQTEFGQNLDTILQNACKL